MLHITFCPGGQCHRSRGGHVSNSPPHYASLILALVLALPDCFGCHQTSWQQLLTSQGCFQRTRALGTDSHGLLMRAYSACQGASTAAVYQHMARKGSYSCA